MDRFDQVLQLARGMSIMLALVLAIGWVASRWRRTPAERTVADGRANQRYRRIGACLYLSLFALTATAAALNIGVLHGGAILVAVAIECACLSLWLVAFILLLPTKWGDWLCMEMRRRGKGFYANKWLLLFRAYPNNP